jgi:hypothetical protein
LFAIQRQARKGINIIKVVNIHEENCQLHWRLYVSKIKHFLQLHANFPQAKSSLFADLGIKCLSYPITVLDRT